MTKYESMLEAYQRSLSPRARYNFDSDIRQWLIWEGDALKGTAPSQLKSFITHCATIGLGQGTLKISSIRHILTSIASLHVRVLEAEDPTKGIIVKSEIKRLIDKNGKNHDQATALRSNHEVPLLSWSSAHRHNVPIPTITALYDNCDATTPRGMRDRVLLGLGQDLGRRSQDFHLFNDSDATCRPDGTGSVLIRRSKTDQNGQGIIKAISARTMKDVSSWRAWKLENSPAASEALLNSVDQKGSVGGRLSPSGINYILRRMVAHTIVENHDVTMKIAWDIAKEVSSHSFRVGLAQDGVGANENVRDICDRGGWEQEVRVLSYARNLNPLFGSVAKLRSLVPLK